MAGGGRIREMLARGRRIVSAEMRRRIRRIERRIAAARSSAKSSHRRHRASSQLLAKSRRKIAPSLAEIISSSNRIRASSSARHVAFLTPAAAKRRPPRHRSARSKYRLAIEMSTSSTQSRDSNTALAAEAHDVRINWRASSRSDVCVIALIVSHSARVAPASF